MFINVMVQKDLLVLNHNSFADGYDEIDRLNCAFLEAGWSRDEFDDFLQIVWDNADKNIMIVIDLNTFHALGGIAIESPRKEPLERVLKIPKSDSDMDSSIWAIRYYSCSWVQETQRKAFIYNESISFSNGQLYTC